MASIPDIDQEVDRLQTLEGLVPSLYDMLPAAGSARDASIIRKNAERTTVS